MDNERQDLLDTFKALTRKLELPSGEGVEKLAFDEMVGLLTQKIKPMLDDDFEGLVNKMYRMDVPEAQFQAALNAGDPESIAKSLATLVVERELLRVRTWKAYQQRKGNGTTE